LRGGDRERAGSLSIVNWIANARANRLLRGRLQQRFDTMLSTVDTLFRRSRQALTGTHPAVEGVVSAGVGYYARSWVRATSLRNRIRYDAPIRPARLYEVDPREIERTLSWTRITPDRKADDHPRFRPPKYELAGQVWGGPWDLETDPLTDSTILQSFRAHFRRDIPWAETEFYAETMAAIESGATPWDCRSEADLGERCARLDRIYERMASDGYLTQTELYERGESAKSRHRLDRVIWGEIAVSVGREGRLLFVDGHNRLAMARVLGLDSVPVVILVRHENWQRRRDRIARGELTRAELPGRFRDHPDLQPLLSATDG